MPHKRTKAVGKLLFVDKKTTPRSIDRFGLNKAESVNNGNLIPLFTLSIIYHAYVKTNH